jgi:hypothetical protein
MNVFDGERVAFAEVMGLSATKPNMNRTWHRQEGMLREKLILAMVYNSRRAKSPSRLSKHYRLATKQF